MTTAAQARQNGIVIAELMIRAAEETLKPRCVLCSGPRVTRTGLCRSHAQWATYWGLTPLFPVVDKVGRRGRVAAFDWAACGTPKQYRKHLRQNVPMCDACRRAENRRVQDSQKKLSKASGNPGSRLIS